MATKPTESALSEITEAITASVLRAISSHDELRRHMANTDAVVIWEPIIRAGGRFILGRGQIQSILNLKAGSTEP